MYEKWRKIFRPEASLFAGVFLVGMLGFFRPFQVDSAHIVAGLTAKGGFVRHPAHFELGKEFLGRDRILFTAGVAPPVRGDLRIELVGPEELEYDVTSRYPPGVPLLNRTHRWYKFQDDKLLGVQPGDDLIVSLSVVPPDSPGKYELILSDDQTNQRYVTVPVLFGAPGQHGESTGGMAAGRPGKPEEAAAAEGEDCH